MKKLFPTLLLSSFALATPAWADGPAPSTFGNAIFNATLTASTGGLNGNGTLSDIFTGTGIDYSVSNTGPALSDPVAYAYTKVSPTTARIDEPASSSSQSLSVMLTFDTTSTGSFVTTYSGGGTQSGTFVLTSVPFTASAPSSDAPLTNMATRLTLASNGFAIGGFIIGGTQPRKILLRVLGPRLKDFGVSDPLADPTMTLYSGQTPIGTNDNWDADANNASVVTAETATHAVIPLPAGSKDSATVVTLAPGGYTAIVRAANGTDTGEVLLETYLLQ